MENCERMYSIKEAANELKRDEKEVKEAARSLKLTLPLSRRNLKEVEENIVHFNEKKKIECARERVQENEEQEETERKQLQENSRSYREREEKSVQPNCHPLNALQQLQKDAEAIESQNQEDENTLDFD